MKISRAFTSPSKPVVSYKMAKSEIKNPDGSVVFAVENIEVPENFSQVAVDILAQKYFRKKAFPSCSRRFRKKMCRNSCIVRSLTKKRSASFQKINATPLKIRQNRFSTGWPGPGLLGLEAEIFRKHPRRQKLLFGSLSHAGSSDGCAKFSAMVQHRTSLGVRYRRARTGTFLCRPLHT